MRKAKIFLAILLAFCALGLFGCGSGGSSTNNNSANNQGSAANEDSGQAGWPSSDIASLVPELNIGKVVHQTNTSTSEYITVIDVTSDQAETYWAEVQNAGFSHIVSETKSTQYYKGFTYVAANDDGVTFSLTWAPGSPSTMTILIFTT